MARFGKPDPTGRSSGIIGGREGKVRRPPAGEPWTWVTAELLTSASWRALSINGHRLIGFLMIEHMNHAGRENGRLRATHEQLRAYGLTADKIRRAVEECAELGLISFTRGGRWAGTNRPSTYRLTFYADANGNPATNDWKAASGRMRAKAKTESCSVFKEYRTPTSRSTGASACESTGGEVIDLSEVTKSARTPTSRSASISWRGTGGQGHPQNISSEPSDAKLARDKKRVFVAARTVNDTGGLE